MRARASCSTSSLKAGGSAILSRMNSPTATSTMLARNGNRQPRDERLVEQPEHLVTAPVESSRPIGTPSCGHEEYQPRRSSGACSTQSSTAPPHSPPRPMPCSIRSSTRSRGAATPIESYVGSRPIAKVDRPMIIIVTTSIGLRPSRSPRWPKRTPPIGRVMKPAAKVVKASVPVSGSNFGKNWR